MIKAFRAFVAASSLILATSSFGSWADAETMPFGLKEGKPYDGTKLTYLATVAEQYAGHAARIQEFTDLTGIEVEFEFIPWNGTLPRILAHKVAGDSEPDLINYKDSWGPSLKDMLLPLDDLMARDGVSLDRYFKAHQETVIYDGKVYGLPIRGHAQMMFYRADLLEKYGLPVPSTWSELIEVAKVIKEKEGLGIAMYYSPASALNVDVWLNILWSMGGELFVDDKVVFNSPEGVRALQLYSDLENKYKVTAEGSRSFQQSEATLSMARGNSAFFLGWWWHYGTRLLGEGSLLQAEQVGFAPMPTVDGGKAVSFASSLATGINAQSENPEAAWEFLKWLTNPDLEKRNVIEKDQRNEIVAVHRENLLDEEVNAANSGLHRVGAQSLETARIVPLVDGWTEVMQILANALSAAVGGADPKQALDQAAAQAQAVIDRR